MKTLEHLTPEIISKIPEYKDRCLKDLYSGKEYDDFDRKKSVSYIEKIYEIAKQKKPIVIFAKDPIEYKVFFELLNKNHKIIDLIFYLKNKEKNSELNLNSKLYSELFLELDSELYSELYSELNSELNSELYSKLYSKLHSEFDSELDSELYSELNSELDSELDSELFSELFSELDSELNSELNSELYSELDSELYSELNSELDSELYSELNSELDSELDSELFLELYSELDSELDSELNFKKIRSYWLYLGSIYSRVYLTWYKFLQDEFHLKTTKKAELDWLYENSFNNIARCYFTNKYVLILRVPKKILRNNNGFHNIAGPAIEWENYGMYYINGRKMPKWIFDGFTKEQFIKEENEEIRAGMYEIFLSKGQEYLKSFLNLEIADQQEVIHRNGEHEIITLYKTKEKYKEAFDINGNSNVKLAWLHLICPSTGQNYMLPTSSHFTNAVECAKFHRPSIIPSELEYQWNSRN